MNHSIFTPNKSQSSSRRKLPKTFDLSKKQQNEFDVIFHEKYIQDVKNRATNLEINYDGVLEPNENLSNSTLNSKIPQTGISKYSPPQNKEQIKYDLRKKKKKKEAKRKR